MIIQIRYARLTEDQIEDILNKALELERLYYKSQEVVPEEFKLPFFELRKILEGIWGHELPERI